MNTAKIFWSGRSQAVRLPKGFRFQSDEVRIRKHGSAVILEPIPKDWAWLDEMAARLDDDVFEPIATNSDKQQERPELDSLFE